MTVRIGYTRGSRALEAEPGVIRGIFNYWNQGRGRASQIVAGSVRFTRADVSSIVAIQLRVKVLVIGVLRIDPDVAPDDLELAVSRVRVFGWLRAPDNLKQVLAAKSG